MRQPVAERGRALFVVLGEPGFRRLSGASNGLEEPPVQRAIAKCRVEALVVTVLPRASRLDETGSDAPLVDPVPDLLRDELGAVVP